MPYGPSPPRYTVRLTFRPLPAPPAAHAPFPTAQDRLRRQPLSASTKWSSSTSRAVAWRGWSNALFFWRDSVGAARGAAAPGAGSAGADLRQVRPGAVDPPRPAAGRHRRRTGQAAGPGAALPFASGAGRTREGLRPAGERGLRRVRPGADRLGVGRPGAFRAAQERTAATKWRSRSCARTCCRSSSTTWPCSTRWRCCSKSSGRTASA